MLNRTYNSEFNVQLSDIILTSLNENSPHNTDIQLTIVQHIAHEIKLR